MNVEMKVKSTQARNPARLMLNSPILSDFHEPVIYPGETPKQIDPEAPFFT